MIESLVALLVGGVVFLGGGGLGLSFVSLIIAGIGAVYVYDAGRSEGYAFGYMKGCEVTRTKKVEQAAGGDGAIA